MRSHPTYAAFERRWQLPVYFQLRWKDIVGKVEDVLAVTRLEPATGTSRLLSYQIVMHEAEVMQIRHLSQPTRRRLFGLLYLLAGVQKSTSPHWVTASGN
jgi:hypothetical protein